MFGFRRLWAVGLLLSLTGAGAECFAQLPPDRPQSAVDSLLHPTMAPDQPLRFERQMADLGELREEDAPQRVIFRFTNTDSEPVVITRIHTGCGCLTARWPQQPVASGSTATVELRYNPANHPRRISEQALVYIAAEKRPVVRLTLTGIVRPESGAWARFPYTMGHLHLKQRQVVFRELAAGAVASERILCGNGGNRPMRLEAELIPPFASFRTEPEVIGPGDEADIVITIDAAKIPVSRRTEESNFPIVVKGLTGRPSERTLHVTIYPNNEN